MKIKATIVTDEEHTVVEQSKMAYGQFIEHWIGSLNSDSAGLPARSRYPISCTTVAKMETLEIALKLLHSHVR
jgi:hypothetical protein